MIVVECYADVAFLKGLGFKEAEIKHPKTGGKGKVFGELVKREESVALVDEEGGWRRYFKKVLGIWKGWRLSKESTTQPCFTTTRGCE